MYFNIFVLSAVSLISSHIATAFRVQYPQVRFTPYDDLTEDQRAGASVFGYTNTTWNTPGIPRRGHPSVRWRELLQSYELEQQKLLKQYGPKLGFPGKGDGSSNDAWDCWSVHYDDYTWEDLVDLKLNSAWEDLGWNVTMWNGVIEEVPDSDNKYYNDLTNVEKTAAGVSCYTKRLWDGDELSSFALDSPKVILVGKEDISRTCNWASKDLGRCKKTMKNHCCNTCGTCDEFKCVNTEGKFLWKKKKKEKLYENCGFLRGKSNKKLVKICGKKGMKETCPENCDPACKVVSV